MHLAKPGAAAAAVLVVLGCWLFSSALFSGKVLGGDDQILFYPPFTPPPGQVEPQNLETYDSAWVFHPDMIEARRQIRDLRLPVWNPYLGAGQPLLASQQVAALYPLNWLSDVFPFWQSLEWVALFKLLIAGIGMLLFGRALGLGRLPSLFAAVSFTFSAYMIGWFAHPQSNVFVLLPWLMLTADRVVTGARWRDACGLALVIALALLAGHPESCLLILLAAALWFAYRTATFARERHEEERPALRRTLLAGAALLVGSCIAAVVLLPFLELLGQSSQLSRSGGPGPRSILETFVLPEQWGRPDKFSLAGGPLNYQERTAYFGALPLLFGVAGLVIRRSRTQIFFVVLFLLALGLVVDIPLYSSLVAKLPGLDRIYRYRALIVCTFSGAVLGAFGLHLLMTERMQRRRVLAALAIGAVPLLLWVALRVDWSQLPAAWSELPVLGDTRRPRDVVELATGLRWILLTLAGIAIVLVAVWRPRLATAAAVVAIAFTAVDLVTLDRGYIPAIPLAQADPPLPASVRFAQAHQGSARVGGGAGLLPNIAERFGLRDSRIHVLPTLERRNKLWFGLGGTGFPNVLALAPRRLASLFAVKYVFVGRGAKLSDPETRLVAPDLYENRAALPRAWVAYDWSRASGSDDALQRIKADTRRGALNRPVIEDAPPPPPTATAVPADPVRFAHDGDTSVELSVKARRPGYVVLADTYYPGWKATVDGHETPIKPANVAFRAVRVPAGTHVVRFEYSPLSLKLGVWLSVLALLATVAALALMSRTARRARRPPA